MTTFQVVNTMHAVMPNFTLLSIKGELVSEGICQKKWMILQKMISFQTQILIY